MLELGLIACLGCAAPVAVLIGYCTLSEAVTVMPDRARRHELTAVQLSERAAGYVALAKGPVSGEARETFARLAEEYARLAAERAAEEGAATRH
jgi:hypothetical protein